MSRGRRLPVEARATARSVLGGVGFGDRFYDSLVHHGTGTRAVRVAPVVSFVVALAVLSLARTVAEAPVVGDEPHYVLIAQSLLRDGDVELDNDYASAARTGNVKAGLAPETHAFRYRDGGPLRPVHNVGLPLLLVPAMAVDASVGAARTVLVVLGAGFAAALMWFLARLRRVDIVVVSASAVASLGLPVLVFSFQVYPDLPAALLTTVALGLLVTRSFRSKHAWGAAALAAFLPWLHVRFGVIAVGLLVAVAARLLDLGSASWSNTRDRVMSWAAARLVAPAIVPAVISGVLLGIFFWRWYGSLLPDAPYAVEPYASSNAFSWANVYRFGLGAILSPTAGLRRTTRRCGWASSAHRCCTGVRPQPRCSAPAPP